MQAGGLERSVTEGADSINTRKPHSPMSDLVLVTDDGLVRIVRMNRPTRRTR